VLSIIVYLLNPGQSGRFAHTQRCDVLSLSEAISQCSHPCCVHRRARELLGVLLFMPGIAATELLNLVQILSSSPMVLTMAQSLPLSGTFWSSFPSSLTGVFTQARSGNSVAVLPGTEELLLAWKEHSKQLWLSDAVQMRGDNRIVLDVSFIATPYCTPSGTNTTQVEACQMGRF